MLELRVGIRFFWLEFNGLCKSIYSLFSYFIEVF